MIPAATVCRYIADALVAGESQPSRIEAIERVLGVSRPWIAPLVRRYGEAFPGEGRPRKCAVLDFLRGDDRLRKALSKGRARLNITPLALPSLEMRPVEAATNWDLPRLTTVGDLADWMSVTPDELDWYADLKTWNGRGSPKLSHYRYKFVEKRSGGTRAIEAPKPNLKAIQRRILDGLLAKVPSHPTAHGFVRGRSIRSFAERHVGKACVLKIDLADFFSTITRYRVESTLMTFGYPEQVALYIAALCTHAIPRPATAHLDRATAELLAVPHLPQGAPTSPSIANICAYRMDCQLEGLAQAAGIAYARYADDLAFSGDGNWHPERFADHVGAIILDSGFRPNYRKTRVMRQGGAQRLTGLVVNRTINVPREDYDLLKAILHNAARNGPDSQNRLDHPNFRSHLDGRVAFFEFVSPERGRKLRAAFEKINWYQ